MTSVARPAPEGEGFPLALAAGFLVTDGSGVALFMGNAGDVISDSGSSFFSPPLFGVVLGGVAAAGFFKNFLVGLPASSTLGTLATFAAGRFLTGLVAEGLEGLGGEVGFGGLSGAGASLPQRPTSLN